MLYGIAYCCKASEASGLPLCIICASIISPLVLILNALFPKSTLFTERYIEISCSVAQSPSEERVRALHMKSICEKAASEDLISRRQRLIRCIFALNPWFYSCKLKGFIILRLYDHIMGRDTAVIHP